MQKYVGQGCRASPSGSFSLAITTMKKFDPAKIVNKIKKSGDRAVCFYLKKFDRVSISPKKFKVGKNEIKSAEKKVKETDKKLYKAIKNAARN